MKLCDRCGDIIDEDETSTYHDRDYVDCGCGDICVRDEEFYKNCSCGGDWVDATECKICGEYFNGEEIYGNICQECLDEHKTFENAIKCGDENNEKVEINGYIAYEFTETQIEEILKRELLEAKGLGIDLNHKEYLEEDESWFSDWVEKENNN